MDFLKEIDEVNAQLLCKCSQKWMTAYNNILGENNDVSSLFLLTNFSAVKGSEQWKLDELSNLQAILEDYSVILDDESYQEKVEKQSELERALVLLEKITG